jgi:hypothetical protein
LDRPLSVISVTPGPLALTIALLPTETREMNDSACCCPAHPVVRVLMPAVQNRPYRVELLFCGHHFRRFQWELAVAGAIAFPLQRRGPVADETLALL